MLKSPFKFLGFNGFAKTPTPSPHNDRNDRTRGKLRKVRHPANTTIDTADRPSTSMGRKFEVDTSMVVSKRKESGEHYQNQPTGQEAFASLPDIHSVDATHTSSPHTQVHETNHLSSVFEDQSPKDSKQPTVQAPTSGDPNPLWTSIPSVHRDSSGGELTHGWDGDHGGVLGWVNSGLDDTPKRLMAPDKFTPDLRQHDAQKQHGTENVNLKKKESNTTNERLSQQKNGERPNPIVIRANTLEDDKNRAGTENVGNQDYREKSKAPGHGDRVKDIFEPELYYYIVPAGLDIIFQDEDGTEITRVGKTIKGTQDHSSNTHTKNIPIVVQDIFGNELFRSSNRDKGSLDDPNLGLPSPNHTAWKTIIVDEKGTQRPLKYAERNISSAST